MRHPRCIPPSVRCAVACVLLVASGCRAKGQERIKKLPHFLSSVACEEAAIVAVARPETLRCSVSKADFPDMIT